MITLAIWIAGCGAPNSTHTDPRPDRDSVESFRPVNAASAEQLLEGKFAGVTLLRLPNGGLAVRIRGTTTLMGSAEPLYVIDGMTIEPGPGGALMGINPYDIESIKVLKDVSATSFYGMRGANGVVVITTKKD